MGQAIMNRSYYVDGHQYLETVWRVAPNKFEIVGQTSRPGGFSCRSVSVAELCRMSNVVPFQPL